MSDVASNLAVKLQVHFGRQRHGHKRLKLGEPPVQAPVNARIPRVTRLLALALRFEQLLREGKAESFSQLAHIGHVSRARLTQIMNLLNLAPDIQEAILDPPPVLAGRVVICEHDLRHVAAEANWHTQRRLWKQLIATLPAQAAVGQASSSSDSSSSASPGSDASGRSSSDRPPG